MLRAFQLRDGAGNVVPFCQDPLLPILHRFQANALLVRLMVRDLPLGEKLCFARCSRRLFRMPNSSSVFAFAHVSLSVTPTRLLMLPLDQHVSGLLWFIPLRVVCTPTESLW